jgi:hypothetical protein
MLTGPAQNDQRTCTVAAPRASLLDGRLSDPFRAEGPATGLARAGSGADDRARSELPFSEHAEDQTKRHPQNSFDTE